MPTASRLHPTNQTDNSVPDHVDAEGGATPIHPRAPPARRGSKTGHNKAFSAATSRTDILGVAAACRTGARNRPRLWGSLLAYGWHALATLRCDPGDTRCLSRARRGLA